MSLGLYWDPMEIVDHPHERLHQHNTFLGMLGRKKANQKLYPNHPDVDLSDAVTHYIIDMELPGMIDASAIKVQKTNWRTLIISGTAARPWRKEKMEEVAAGLEEGKDGAPLSRVDKSGKKSDEEDDERPPWLLVAERKIGSFRREFHFPVEVDMEKLTCTLKAGLLQVKVPKREQSFPKRSQSVPIAVEE